MLLVITLCLEQRSYRTIKEFIIAELVESETSAIEMPCELFLFSESTVPSISEIRECFILNLRLSFQQIFIQQLLYAS